MNTYNYLLELRYRCSGTGIIKVTFILELRYHIEYFYNRELQQRRRRRQQERYKFAYLTMKNSSFARFARAFFIFGHLADVLVVST